MTVSSTITVIGCGGGGINNIKRLIGQDAVAPGFSQLRPAIIDTSDANVKDIDLDRVDHFLNVGLGSGKLRALNIDAIRADVKSAIQKIKPTKVVIIVFTGMGGSGSVWGPAVIRELLLEGHIVFPIVLGGNEDGTALQNTVRTIETLAAIQRGTKKSLSFFYRFMDFKDPNSEKKADESVVAILDSLSVLLSRQNDRLDFNDVNHWVNYDVVVKGAQPQLGLIDVYTTNADVEQAEGVLSLASLYSNEAAERATPTVAYSTVGYCTADLGDAEALHFTICPEAINGIHAKLDECEVEMRKLIESANSANRGISLKHAATEDDFVL